MAPLCSGLARRPLKAVAGVRIPSGLQGETPCQRQLRQGVLAFLGQRMSWTRIGLVLLVCPGSSGVGIVGSGGGDPKAARRAVELLRVEGQPRKAVRCRRGDARSGPAGAGLLPRAGSLGVGLLRTQEMPAIGQGGPTRTAHRPGQERPRSLPRHQLRPSEAGAHQSLRTHRGASMSRQVVGLGL